VIIIYDDFQRVMIKNENRSNFVFRMPSSKVTD